MYDSAALWITEKHKKKRNRFNENFTRHFTEEEKLLLGIASL
jgi:hypothetical protein